MNKLTTKQIESIKGFIGEWTSIGLITPNEFLEKEYPDLYIVQKRINADFALIDAICDGMQARIGSIEQ